MRRSARGEPSGFSLFPFLAVLLCTMGTLVVLLVAMARVSHEKSLQEAAVAKAAAEAAAVASDSPERRAIEERLQQAEAAIEQLRTLKAEDAERLAQEQKRLSDIEDHVRRLREETEALTAEAEELFAVEGEHYDDEKIAQQELERLNRLVGEIEDQLEKARFAAAGRERRYAVKPLRDARTGTLRPPTYYECRASGVVLQPEGIELGWADLVAADFSSPVGAAQRAVARFYEQHPEARAANEVGAPYPLLVVRPDGVHAYYLARSAFETGGVEYGYQPVAEDWPLEYGEANPVLGSEVAVAIEDARSERVGLSRMIPQLASALATAETDARRAISRGQGGAGGGGLVSIGMPGGSSQGSAADGTAPSGGYTGLRVRPANLDSNNPFDGLRIEGSLPGESPDGGGGYAPENLLATRSAGEDPSQAASGAAPSLSPGTGGPQLSGPTGIAAIAAQQPTTGAQPADAGEANGASGGSDAEASAGTPPPQGAVAMNALTPQQKPPATAQTSATTSAGNPSSSSSAASSSSTGNDSGREGVPMVRPIQLYVSQSRVVLLPDGARAPEQVARSATPSQGVDFKGATSAQINDVIAILKRHADSWGIAGDGMYWDPRLVLNVAPDGTQRADEVRRLLSAAGVKVQAYPVTTAVNPPPNGGSNATRR